MKWTIAKARQDFSKLLKKAESDPQAIYNRNQMVAAVINVRLFQEFSKWASQQRVRTIADAFGDLRPLLQKDAEIFTAPSRQDRKNDFAEAMDELSG
ncbi:MAG: type II toxin-antitoxin system prevent-host-death family antitoxin [Planctomycetes bacterium]|nr:type II toxin-antitoxin system prevent-host-death family antitoxin [Planctomycetota bacterium]